jgi:hypothetical protein
MPRPHYALAAIALLVWPLVAGAQTSLTPEAGLLVLRNGQVLEGEVTQAGDYYVVTLGGTSEIRIKTAEVEAVCGSLDEAYEFKAGHLSGNGAKPHLELAEWCLRHHLHARCAQQLVAAMRLEPNNPSLKLLERRLEFAAQQPKAIVATPTAASSAVVSSEQVEKAIRELPAGSIEKFSAIVQPILLNRCGANQCHGPNSKAEFRLLRPAPGQVASRRFTERNLYAALQQLDPSQPDDSRLLILPQRRHGSALSAVFDNQSQKQLSELSAWVKLTLAAPHTSPATIPDGTATLSQPTSPATTPTRAPQAEQPVGSQPLSGVRAMKPAIGAEERKSSPTADRFVPRDRFDPEIFNRRYLK